MNMTRGKRQYPEDFKTMLGLSTLNWTETISGSFMTGLFMLYMTDFSGIGPFAPVLVTGLLFGGRLFDAINDPLQGFIMDRKRPGRFGKYKPFIILSTIMITVALIFMFSIPDDVAANRTAVVIWVVVCYLLYDTGVSFFAEGPLRQTLSTDPVVRARMTTWPRVVSMIIVIPVTFFIPMATTLNRYVSNMGRSFSILAVTFIVGAGVVSLLGISAVKEGANPVQEEKVSLSQVWRMIITNRPLIVNTVVTIFHGFVWTLVFATTTFYVRWAYAADLTTGAVDNDRFGTLTMILGIFQLLPSILMAAVSPVLVRRFGPVRVFAAAIALELVGGLALFLLMVVGVLHTSPVAFFACILVILLGIGLSFVPGSLIGLEALDYAIYKSGGKVANGTLNAVNRFVAKMQTAFSAAIVGGVLILIGYEVDAATDTFIGNLDEIPRMLNAFIVVSGLVPAILCLLSLIALRFYPINDRAREQLRESLEAMKHQETELASTS